MFFGIRDLPYLKAGIWDFNENWRWDSGLKVCMEYEMPKITIGITGLRENWGRDNRIEEPYWETLKREVYFIFLIVNGIGVIVSILFFSGWRSVSCIIMFDLMEYVKYIYCIIRFFH